MSVATQFPPVRAFEDDPRFRALFEGAALGIAICQLDGRILEANPALGLMLGYSRQELVEAHACELCPQLARNLFAEAGRDVGRDLHPASVPNERLLGELLTGARESFEVERRYRRKDGSGLWACLTVSLGRDARRQPAFLIAMLADATEHKRVEDHLREAAKMEVVGRLAGGIAHDFNNLLTGILLYCDLLSAGLEDRGLAAMELANRAPARSDLCRHVDEVRMAGEQGAALTHQLLAIARKQAAEPRPIRINEIVASLQNLLRRLLGEHIELLLTLDSAAGLVLADPAQMSQVVLNLVLNARDAMPQGGRICLITRSTVYPRAEFQAQFTAAVPCASRSNFPQDAAGDVTDNSASEGSRHAVSLTVKDNGCGMNAETRTRLFEPFFTTKNPGKGTGLGMATVQRIVAEAGGKIAVESEEGRGTCIEVLFPAVEVLTVEPSMQGSP
jgi:PAS domain S-box-containing protein